MRPLKKTVETEFSNGYDAARRRLVTDLGSYCSYCEAVVSSDLPVEHKLPKKAIPLARTAAFNLLLACHACNNAKGARPERNGREADDEYKLAAIMMADMMWPDTYKDAKIGWPEPDPAWLATTGTFRYFRQSYSQIDLAGFNLLPLTEAERKESWTQEKQDRVWVAPDQRLDALKKERALATINILKLNRNNDVDPGHNDRRVLNRTYAWDSATNAARSLIGAIAPHVRQRGTLPYDAFLNRMWLIEMELVRRCAAMTGYWSIWMTVFGKALQAEERFDQGIRLALLYLLFIAPRYSTGEEDIVPMVFTGTDLGRISAWDFLR